MNFYKNYPKINKKMLNAYYNYKKNPNQIRNVINNKSFLPIPRYFGLYRVTKTNRYPIMKP